MTSKPRVLYVDDDPGSSRLVQRHLERAGFEVACAADGEAGLTLAREGGFDAIALDHYLPGRDGLEMLADLRELPGAPPVVFVTAAEEPRIAVAALKEGAADYVIKDVQGAFLELMAESLRQAMEQRRRIVLALVDRGGKRRQLLACDRCDEIGNGRRRVGSFNARYGQ